MKKIYYLLLLISLILMSCGGNRTAKTTPKPTPPVISKPAPTPTQTPAPSTNAPTPNNPDGQIGDNSKKLGGYYLDDGPDANPPKNIDDIPNATPKKEFLPARSNKPYKALGKTYTPLSSAQNYKERGVASWYGKRFHGKKTANGEIYDMYSMSAAHTVLPLPSYVKVTNVDNGRSVIVRVNDRGPFKSTRIIDLSYAAAYKLRLIAKGSGMVEVEALHPDQIASNPAPALVEPAPSQAVEAPAITPAATSAPVTETPVITEAKPVEVKPAEIKQTSQAPAPVSTNNTSYNEYFVQAGAFKSEANAEALMKKIQGFEIEQNAGINRVYNNGLHRLKLGPYETKQAAEEAAGNIRKQLNIPAIVTNQ